ncbi:integral membrane sensor signal transduction histidine kinase [Scytonema sp. HK-05]|uniref:sensor histidine kinase n=1 Tax=Scytonema sp. HK-05 TaxID=1137095 RepID=UPI000936B882|nr:sensor histidine kinase [Scytonema sp. HK-05]OKH56728.1 two-component sensor histidine kinase [Scytonema sp. HK-05]BAY49218.1 integral membrane sensor signal transduction histidine kinase [Scytonema sp. HK-05]
MTRPIQFNNHPFRFLLYLEWILLAFAALTAALPSHSYRLQARFPELTICSLMLFGLMGLRLPTRNHITKIVYTAAEIFLILIIDFFGGRTARIFPFFYVILVTRSCLIFQLPGRLVVTALSFVLFLITFRRRFARIALSPASQERFLFFTLSFVLVFGLALLFVLLLMNAVISERESREKLAIANEKLRQYALQIENQATLEERNRIAREIHDSLGHSLTALNLQLETGLKLWQSNPTKAQAFLAKAKELGSKALQDVRQSVSTMRSHPLQEQSLEQAIASLAENVQRSTGVAPICQIQLSQPLPVEMSTAIYRIVQESFTNICKYAQATEVKLEITTTKNSLQLTISDNGIGFDFTQNTTGFGLQSMRDRTLALGGYFNINSAPGSGCQITATIPLSRSLLTPLGNS